MKVKYRAFSAIVIILVILRIALPYLFLPYLNNQLNKNSQYNGHIDSLAISFFLGSIYFKNIEIKSRSNPSNAFKADSIKLSIHILPLFNGKIVIDVKVNKPIVDILVGSFTPQSDNTKLPITVHKLSVTDGEFNIINLQGKPHFKVSIKKINVFLEEIYNEKTYRIDLDAKLMDSGNFSLKGKLNPFYGQPNFYIQASLKDLDIPELNKVLKHYTDITTKAGKFNLFLEAIAKGGKISGYAKPFIKDLSIIERDDDNAVQKIYKSAVKLTVKILENPHQETNATKINVSGDIKDPDVSVLSIVLFLLEHAFIQGLVPGIDHQFSSANIDYNQRKSEKIPTYKP